MRWNRRRGLVVAASLSLTLAPPPIQGGSDPVTTTFTYQGTLLDDGAVPTGSYDFLVGLYDSPTALVPITLALPFEDVPVAEGLFQLTLDFGYHFFGERRWLEIAVRDGGSSGDYEPLLPRQELTATPNAQFATTSLWFNLLGKPEGFDDDVDDDLLNALPCAVGEVPILTESGWDCATYAAGGGAGWQLTGNAGTVPGTHFLGTTDTTPLELRADNLAAFRIEPVNAGLGGHFNIVGGLAALAPDLNCVTVAGGGLADSPNRVFSNASTIGGGYGNEVGTSGAAAVTGAATVAGGSYNWARGGSSTVGGGSLNRAEGEAAAIGGGVANRVHAVRATIAGGEQNEVYGARGTIGGGGNASWARGNVVWNDFGTIAGGGSNEAGLEGSAPADEPYTTVGGGRRNLALSHGATVAGGELNRVQGDHAFIGGGQLNNVFDEGGVIGGGESNSAGLDDGDDESQSYATVAGGVGNSARETSTFVGGGNSNEADELEASVVGGRENQAAGIQSVVAGGLGNEALGIGSMVGAGSYNLAEGQDSWVGAGAGNVAAGSRSAVAGGSSNVASGALAVVAGGSDNDALAEHAAIAGGSENVVWDQWGAIGGGRLNVAGLDDGDPLTQSHATVAGGFRNKARGAGAFVGGGFLNEADGFRAVILGGTMNHADGSGAAVVGGLENSASGDGAAVAAGYANAASGARSMVGAGTSNVASGDNAVVSGGSDNTAQGSRSAVGGGGGNLASGDGSAIPGGSDNIAGCLNCFAAGSYAHAIHQGSFVWAEHTSTAHVPSPAEYTFSVQASGGVWLGTDRSPSIPVGVFLNTSTGGYLSSTGDWTNASDRRRKEGFEPFDGARVLEAVRGLPLSTWSYIGDPGAVRHLGPMAQDFRAAFGLGRDEVSISTVDAAGVALAAIQELARKTEELERALTALEALERRLAALEARGGAR